MPKKPVPIREIREAYIEMSDQLRSISKDNNYLLQRIGASMDEIRTSLTANQVGVANVYAAFEKSQEAIKKERKMLEDKQLELTVKSYPMNTRVILKVETNFGEIDFAFDYPPISENQLGEVIQNTYGAMLNELYDKHEERGGKFIGEDGCKDWMEKNGRTVIHKEPLNSPRVNHE